MTACSDNAPATPTPDAGGAIDAGRDANASPWVLVPAIDDPDLAQFSRLLDMTAARSDLYVVGEEGIVLRSVDNGASWTNVGEKPPVIGTWFTRLDAVAGSAPDDVISEVVVRSAVGPR